MGLLLRSWSWSWPGPWSDTEYERGTRVSSVSTSLKLGKERLGAWRWTAWRCVRSICLCVERRQGRWAGSRFGCCDPDPSQMLLPSWNLLYRRAMLSTGGRHDRWSRPGMYVYLACLLEACKVHLPMNHFSYGSGPGGGRPIYSRTTYSKLSDGDVSGSVRWASMDLTDPLKRRTRKCAVRYGVRESCPPLGTFGQGAFTRDSRQAGT